MGNSLEEMLKNIVISDIHIPFQDDKAVKCVFDYMQDYKPNRVVINGDLVDFYHLSVFDKNPERKGSVQKELEGARDFLSNLRKVVGKKCEIVMTEGNHENRLQRYLWRNPELEGLDELDLAKLLHLNKYKVDLIRVNSDYWKKDTGHYKIGDMVIMHGDNRLNGAKSSQYSGYSAKNTMLGIQSSVIIGHVHRLAQVYHSTPYGTLIGIEGGSLCQHTGTANWQQGFVTFDSIGGKTKNFRLHHIEEGKIK